MISNRQAVIEARHRPLRGRGHSPLSDETLSRLSYYLSPDEQAFFKHAVADMGWLIGEVDRLQRFEAMWEDCRQQRDRAEVRARRYMETVQQIAAIVAPDEEGVL